MKSYFTDIPQERGRFLNLLQSPKRIVLCCHQNPDGDAFGSSLGLYHILKNLKHKCTFISPTSHSSNLEWLPGVQEILNFEGHAKEQAKSLIRDAEILFCLDFSAFNRLKEMADEVKRSQAMKVLIDHHQEPERFADFVYWNERASSTCELVYELAKNAGWQLSRDSATCLYTGLVTDTGSFRFDSTTSQVHQIAAELHTYEIDHSKIHQLLFDNQKLDRLKLLGYALSKKLVHLKEFKTAYISLSEEELKTFNYEQGDTEGLVNYGLSIEGVVFAAIFLEKDGLIKISFRSTDSFSVSDFSRNHFNGGGHKNAAGGRSHLCLEETIEKFLNLLPTYKSKLV